MATCSGTSLEVSYCLISYHGHQHKAGTDLAKKDLAASRSVSLSFCFSPRVPLPVSGKNGVFSTGSPCRESSSPQ